jgi:hypothetical protein
MTEQELVQSRPTFDYDQLDGATWKFVKDATDQIRQLARRSSEAMVKWGDLLLAVKERLNHGQFQDWLLAEFDWTPRHAENFMAVARRFGESEYEIISALQPTALTWISHRG